MKFVFKLPENLCGEVDRKIFIDSTIISNYGFCGITYRNIRFIVFEPTNDVLKLAVEVGELDGEEEKEIEASEKLEEEEERNILKQRNKIKEEKEENGYNYPPRPPILENKDIPIFYRVLIHMNDSRKTVLSMIKNVK